MSQTLENPSASKDRRPQTLWHTADKHDLETAKTFLVFDIGSQCMAADVAVVREILDAQEIAALPNGNAGMIGMIDIRGEAIAVMDISQSIGLMRHGNSPEERLIVLEMQDGQVFAFPADKVRQVVELNNTDIEPVPVVPGSWESGAMVGVAKVDGRTTYVVDLYNAFGLGSANNGANFPGPFDFS